VVRDWLVVVLPVDDAPVDVASGVPDVVVDDVDVPPVDDPTVVTVLVTVIVLVGASESSSERWWSLRPIGCETSLLAAKVTPAAIQSPSRASTVTTATLEIMVQA